MCHNREVMQTIKLDISDDELLEVSHADRVLQRFFDKIISPNELYQAEFLKGLEEARIQVRNEEYSEVDDLADFIQ
jgi:hypothetical protein